MCKTSEFDFPRYIFVYELLVIRLQRLDLRYICLCVQIKRSTSSKNEKNQSGNVTLVAQSGKGLSLFVLGNVEELMSLFEAVLCLQNISG